jgi:short subunit dehydrogenase-like uncharacterized protein
MAGLVAGLPRGAEPVEDGRADARQQTPYGYDLPVQTSLAAVARVLAGEVAPGFYTPAMAFGPDFILKCTGVTRTDELTDQTHRPS